MSIIDILHSIKGKTVIDYDLGKIDDGEESLTLYFDDDTNIKLFAEEFWA